MIGVIGINHKTAPIRVRELFALGNTDISQLIASFKQDGDYFREALVLSTCNRTEIYFRLVGICEPGSKRFILKNLQKILNIPDIDVYNEFFYCKYGDMAIRHMLEVSSGLDSMALGEYQIVNQLKDAYDVSKNADGTGKYLTRLFNKALQTSKIVRNKTGISEGATSVSYIAVDHCMQFFPSIQDKHILLIGVGETGELVLKKFKKKGAGLITIANRTLSKAQERAGKYNANALPFEKITQHLHEFDVVIASTSAKNYVLNASDIAWSSEKRRTLPQIFVDLGVPRNIEESANNFKGVTLINVDDLESILKQNMKKREQMLEKANEYVEEGVQDFSNWLSNQNLSPLAVNIKEKMRQVNELELEGFKKNRSEAEQELISMYGKHIAEKYSRLFIKNLMEKSQNGKKTEYLKLVNELFEWE